MKLREYRKKRKFDKTREPEGKVVESKPDNLAYVIQKHQASHLHYDLRLEWEGVLLSWAVPKEPTTDERKRLAVRTEDHPVQYAGFEGTIPKGEYGAGEVRIWDKGIWVAEEVKEDRIVAQLKGQKLKGRFALIKFKNQDKNWLFFKL